MPTDNRATAERIARDFAAVINSHSAENDSDTPDFILSNALTAMLDAMQRAIVARDDWYGGKPGMAHRDRTAEREAVRAMMFALAQQWGCEYPEKGEPDGDNFACAGCIGELEKLAAAVRARALADVAGWVEGMERGRNYEPHEEERAWGWDEALDAILAKLREAK